MLKYWDVNEGDGGFASQVVGGGGAHRRTHGGERGTQKRNAPNGRRNGGAPG